MRAVGDNERCCREIRRERPQLETGADACDPCPEGEYQDDKKEGTGVYLWPSGAKYEGQYKENKRHGIGTYYFASGERAGDSYNGEWKANNMDGKGTYTYKNKDIYIGGFAESKQHGPGELTQANGDAWIVRYERGNEVSRVKKAAGNSPRSTSPRNKKDDKDKDKMDLFVNIPSTVEVRP